MSANTQPERDRIIPILVSSIIASLANAVATVMALAHTGPFVTIAAVIIGGCAIGFTSREAKVKPAWDIPARVTIGVVFQIVGVMVNIIAIQLIAKWMPTTPIADALDRLMR